MSPDELIKVLKACKSARVTELKVGDIVVKLGAFERAPIGKSTGDAVTIPPDSELEAASTKASLAEQASDAEEQLAFMQIDDPAEYERLIAQRELLDGREKAQSADV